MRLILRPIVTVIALTAACGSIQPATTPRLPEDGPTGSVAGFDTRVYPGTAAMQAWRTNSPYRWVGYYLSAPCYTGNTWVGKRAELHAQGWGTAVLFVGEQDWRAMGRTDSAGVATQNPRCTATNLTEANGRLHAQAADSTALAEGFTANTHIFLDVERVDSVSAPLASYVRAWTAQLLADKRFVPALYAHERNANVLVNLMSQEFRSAGRNQAPILWVAKSSTTFMLESRPAESGLLNASIWQGILNRQEVWGGITLTIDINTAARSVPGLVRSSR